FLTSGGGAQYGFEHVQTEPEGSGDQRLKKGGVLPETDISRMPAGSCLELKPASTRCGLRAELQTVRKPVAKRLAAIGSLKGKQNEPPAILLESRTCHPALCGCGRPGFGVAIDVLDVFPREFRFGRDPIHHHLGCVSFCGSSEHYGPDFCRNCNRPA